MYQGRKVVETIVDKLAKRRKKPDPDAYFEMELNYWLDKGLSKKEARKMAKQKAKNIEDKDAGW